MIFDCVNKDKLLLLFPAQSLTYYDTFGPSQSGWENLTLGVDVRHNLYKKKIPLTLLSQMSQKKLRKEKPLQINRKIFQLVALFNVLI